MYHLSNYNVPVRTPGIVFMLCTTRVVCTSGTMYGNFERRLQFMREREKIPGSLGRSGVSANGLQGAARVAGERRGMYGAVKSDDERHDSTNHPTVKILGSGR